MLIEHDSIEESWTIAVTKQIATPKQTSGAGFAFEDKVVAFYLVQMLAELAPFSSPKGTIVQIDCQVAVDGWNLDDLLLTLSEAGQHHRVAFSIKSNKQFVSKRVPAEFVEAAWSLLLHNQSDHYEVNSDAMGMITPTQSDALRTALNGLCGKAITQTPEQLHRRIDSPGYSSEVERSLYHSLACPSPLKEQYIVSEESTGLLLQHLHFVQVDFDSIESEKEMHAIQECARLLEKYDMDEAMQLWNAICLFAQQVRNHGGGYDRRRLSHALSTRFALRGSPNYVADWNRLHQLMERELGSVRDRIGSNIQIDRQDFVRELLRIVDENICTALIGESGSGKSVIAKMLAFSTPTQHVLWFDAGRFTAGYVEDYEASQKLRHSLEDILAEAQHIGGLIVIDRAERLIEEDSLREIAKLLGIVSSANAIYAKWHILFTSRRESWEQVERQLHRHTTHVERSTVVPIVELQYGDLQPVWIQYPQVKQLALRPHLKDILALPGILNVIVNAIGSGIILPVRDWIGESDIQGWYWQSIVRLGPAGASRDLLLTKLAERDADNGAYETLESELSADDLGLVPDLSEMLRVDQVHGKISFAHDIYADWTRLRCLQINADNLARYLENRWANPRWHSAIRMYGAYLLENSDSITAWHDALHKYPSGTLLLLDALIFSGNSNTFLKKVWPVLVGETGALLRSFLKRFRSVATFPDPRWVQLAEENSLNELEMATEHRLPTIPYWQGILPVLAEQAQEVVSLAPREAAIIAATWLNAIPVTWLLRSEASTLAVVSGWHALREARWNASKDAFMAALAAIRERPEDVRLLALKASGRIAPSEDDGAIFEDFTPPGEVVALPDFLMYGSDSRMPDPWPDGPIARANSIFQEVCITGNGLDPIIDFDPKFAQEILLALLIRRRDPRSLDPHHRSISSLEERMGINQIKGFDSPIYFLGPFLRFLNQHPDHAISTIIRLVDFATERWLEVDIVPPSGVPGATIQMVSGDKRFIGNSEVFYWYHSSMAACAVTSALMALEKWLYLEIDANRPIGKWTAVILHEASSVAFLGMLTEVGRYSPRLFETELFPLLTSTEVYGYETPIELRFGLTTPLFHSEWYFDRVREWALLPHRKMRLIDIAVSFFHTNDLFHQQILAARTQWLQIRNANKEDETRDYMIEVLGEANWSTTRQSDGTVLYTFTPPQKDLSSHEEQEALVRHQLLLFRPLDCRMRLKENRPLPDSEVEPFLLHAQALATLDHRDLTPDILDRTSASICGSIAVLFVLHREWLRAHPDHENWCIDQLRMNLSQVDQLPRGESVNSTYDRTWLHFVCDLAPILLAENPMVAEWRELVATIVFVPNYRAIGILMNGCFALRGRLGDDFWRLVRMTLEWAQRKPRSVNSVQKDADALNVWVVDSVQQFVGGTYLTTLPAWGQNSIASGVLRNQHSSYGYSRGKIQEPMRRVPHIDMWFMMAAFGEILLPVQSSAAEEYNLFCAFWDQALIVLADAMCLYDYSGSLMRGDDRLTYPDGPYRWILQQLALVLVEDNSESHQKYLIGEVLGSGARARDWIGIFLYEVFHVARHSVQPSLFSKVWTDMLNHCLSSPAWALRSSRSRDDVSCLWLELMGISSSLGTVCWGEKDVALIKTMIDYYQRAVPYILARPSSAVRFMRWMSESTSKGLRLPLLGTITGILVIQDKTWWQSERVAAAVAHYLDAIYKEEKQLLSTGSAHSVSFLQLLHIIASTNEPMALELQARIRAYRSNPRSK